MRAARIHHPYARGTFRYSPSSLGTLKYVGEQSEDWYIYGVPDGFAPIDVAQCLDLPQPGDPMENHDDWLVSRIENVMDTADANKSRGTCTWRCTVVYVPDPEKLPVEIHYNSNRVMEVVYSDVDTGDPIVNGAGDLFNPPVQEPRCVIRLRIIKRYNGDEFVLDLKAYADHRSSTAITIPGLGEIDAGHVYCAGLDAALVQEPLWHYMLTADLEVDADEEFAARLLNQGYQYKDSKGKKVLFADDYGVPHGGPGLLNADGTKADSQSPNWLTFQTKPQADLNQLGLFA